MSECDDELKNPKTSPGIVLPTGPGSLPEVRFLASGSVLFGSKPGQKPNPLCPGGVVT